MDLKQLRTFLRVADLGSLSKAAEVLHIAQPALGRQIKMLEDELSVALFTRHGRGMVLTPAGHLLLERASAILRLVEDTRAEVSAEPNTFKGAVSLGVPPTAGEVIAGPLIEGFVKQYPGVAIRIVPAFSGYLHDMLQRGEVDLAVMYETPGVRRLRPEPMVVESLYLIGPKASKLTMKTPVRYEQLADIPMILPGPRHGLRALLEGEARNAEIRLDVPVEAESLQTLKDLVLRGLGHTILPLAAVNDEMKTGTMCAAPIIDPELSRKLVLVRSMVKPGSKAVGLFAESLKAQTVEMVRTGIWPGTLLIQE